MFIKKILENQEIKNFIDSNSEEIEKTQENLNNLQNEIFNTVKENINDFVENKDIVSTFENIKQYAKFSTLDKLDELSESISDNKSKENT